MFKLEFPNESHRSSVEEIRTEWSKAESTPTSPVKLFSGDDFDGFLSIIQNDSSELTAPKGWVPAHLFLFVQEETAKILWAIQIRHHIDHPNLIEMWGHIGYGVRPDERGKGYATRMLGLALEEARKLGLERVLITCDDENVGSWKVIEANGGVFERFSEKDGTKGRRYWIELGK